jgi:hypothetical protein
MHWHRERGGTPAAAEPLNAVAQHGGWAAGAAGGAMYADAAGTKVDGWNWVDPAQASIELFGSACTSFESNRHTSVVVEVRCMPVLVTLD